MIATLLAEGNYCGYKPGITRDMLAMLALQAPERLPLKKGAGGEVVGVVQKLHVSEDGSRLCGELVFANAEHERDAVWSTLSMEVIRDQMKPLSVFCVAPPPVPKVPFRVAPLRGIPSMTVLLVDPNARGYCFAVACDGEALRKGVVIEERELVELAKSFSVAHVFVDDGYDTGAVRDMCRRHGWFPVRRVRGVVNYASEIERLTSGVGGFSA